LVVPACFLDYAERKLPCLPSCGAYLAVSSQHSRVPRLGDSRSTRTPIARCNGISISAPMQRKGTTPSK
jgi:hypothetical protein